MARAALSKLAVAVLLTGWAVCALSQETPPRAAGESPRGTPDARPARVDEAKPPVYYLKDKQGRLQPVPGFSLEEFEELYKLKNDLKRQEQRPSYSLQRFTLAGTATGEYADLTATIAVQVREENWVRVPLRLDRALLREAAGYRGPGEHFLHFEPDGDGYVGWIRGQAGQQHELTLKMLVPVAAGRDGHRLRMTLPRATISELKLRVPVANAEAHVSDRAKLQQTAAAGPNATEFTVLGPTGDFEISWRRPGAETTAGQPVLEASATILSRIDTRSVDSGANLSVRSLGEPFDSFRVRLPAQSELVPNPSSGYTVSAAPSSDEGEAAPPVVEVKMARRTSGPVEVRLTTRRPALPAGTDPVWTDLAGFEVVGAARQWGTLAVTVMSDWQIIWGPSRSVRQTEQLPESLRRDDIVSAFDYYAQPFSLSARLTPKKTRINLEPEYRITIADKEATLEARLKYVLRGAKVFSLEVTLPDWELEDVGPENVVASDGVSVGDGKLITIPLIQPSTGPVEIRLRARKEIAAGAKSVNLQLPQPKASSISPASVLISSPDHIELAPRPQGTVGLIREQLPSSLKVPDRQQTPLFYRSDASKATFSAELRPHSRHIAATAQSILSLEEQSGRMEQRFQYAISHEATDGLTLLVPPQLAASDELEFEFQGSEVNAIPADNGVTAADGQSVRFRVLLPAPAIGPCELKIRYPLPTPPLSPGNRVVLTAPLIMPEGDRLSANRLTVTAARNIGVQPLGGTWSPASAAVITASQRVTEMTAEGAAGSIELALQLDDAAITGSTVIDRLWVQSWFTLAARQDRYVARFSTNLREVELTLPAGAVPAPTGFTLDGRPLGVVTIKQNVATVPLSGDATTMHVLEARYHFVDAWPKRGPIAADFPRLGPSAWVRRAYWQVVLPGDEHALWPPNGLIDESRLAWGRLCWGRQPLLEQADLETWTGVVGRGPLPPSTNCYLYGALGPLEHAELQTVPRTWLVLGASGVALTLALVLIYVPLMRRPASLLVLSASLVGAGALYPEAAVVVAQAAGLGVVLGVLAAILARQLRQRVVAPAVAPEALSAQTRLAASPLVASSSTKTAPAADPVRPQHVP